MPDQPLLTLCVRLRAGSGAGQAPRATYMPRAAVSRLLRFIKNLKGTRACTMAPMAALPLHSTAGSRPRMHTVRAGEVRWSVTEGEATAVAGPSQLARSTPITALIANGSFRYRPEAQGLFLCGLDVIARKGADQLARTVLVTQGDGGHGSAAVFGEGLWAGGPGGIPHASIEFRLLRKTLRPRAWEPPAYNGLVCQTIL